MPPPHLGNPELPAQKVPLLQQNNPHSYQISDCDATEPLTTKVTRFLSTI